MAAKLTDEERARIAAELRSGKTPYAVAKESGRSRTTVASIAHDFGIALDVQRTKKATEAKRDYALTERLILGNEFFDKAREMLPGVATPQELKDLAITFGTLVDKRRLDDDLPTEKGDYTYRDADASVEKFFEALDQFALEPASNSDGEADTQ